MQHTQRKIKNNLQRSQQSQQHLLKELEHRKLGWKVLILKYNLVKSLSTEKWRNMADTKEMIDFIF